MYRARSATSSTPGTSRPSEAAQEALRLRPDCAKAWNNIAASDNCLSRFDDAIQAAEHALRLRFDFELARSSAR